MGCGNEEGNPNGLLEFQLDIDHSDLSVMSTKEQEDAFSYCYSIHKEVRNDGNAEQTE